MSRGAGETAGLGPFGRILALAAPALTALILAAIVALPPSEPDQELHLLAPPVVPCGAIVPVRAYLYSGVSRPEGPTLVTAPARVELLGPKNERWASTALRTGFGRSLEGELRTTCDRVGHASLIARASYRDAQPAVEREIRIAAPGSAPPRADQSALHRDLPPLRSFALGPVRTLGGEPEPQPFDARIRGGACVPEMPCELLVHAGEPPATVVAEASASVTVALPARDPPAGGVASLFVTAHGPEAELTLRAERGALAVARRSVRLALALGAEAIARAPDVVRAGETSLVALHGPGGCIVDAFVDTRWARTGSLRDCSTPQPLPFAALEPGAWQLQLRRDPFPSDSAAVRNVFIARPTQPPDEIAAQVARAALAFDPSDASAKQPLPDAAQSPPNPATMLERARYLLAGLDRRLLPLPQATSGYAAAVLRIQATRGKLRRVGLLALGVCGLVLAALLGQRGLDAAEQAGRLLRAAGTDPRALRRARIRMALRVFAVFCGILLVFAAIATYVIARAAAEH